MATGFNRNHRLNGEGGRIVEEWFVETVIDRVETTGTTWLALTMTCARCHDHKYDPISQKEFFEFFAFFNSNDESGVLAANGKNGFNTMPFIKVASAEDKKKQGELEAKLKEAEQAAARAHKADMSAAFEKWLVAERKAHASNKDKPVWVSLSGGEREEQGWGDFQETSGWFVVGLGQEPVGGRL